MTRDVTGTRFGIALSAAGHRTGDFERAVALVDHLIAAGCDTPGDEASVTTHPPA